MATPVTVLGTSNTTVTIPFTSTDNANLAQYAAYYAVNGLPDTSKFVAAGASATTTGALGIISNINGPTIAGTAANATIIAGGSGFSYTAGGSGQSVFFSASGTGNLLANGAGAGSTTYYLDAGGSSSLAGTTLSAPYGTAVVNDFSGYLNLNGGTFTVSVVGAGAGLTATGSDVIASGNGVSFTLADGAQATVEGTPNNMPADTITAAGGGSLTVYQASATVNQTGGGNLVLGSAWGGVATVNAAAGATETITYTGAEGANVVANNDSLTLAGSGPGNFTVTGSGSITNTAALPASLGGTGALTLAGGAFVTGATAPALTAVGTTDTISSYVGAAITLADGAAATVQGVGAHYPADTITASGGGSLMAAYGATAQINQTAGGDFLLGTWSGGSVTVNAAAGATETITYTGAEGANVVTNNDSLTLAGSGPGNITVSGSGSIINTAAAGASVTGTGTITLAGGMFVTGSVVPTLTFTGTTDVIDSYVGIGATLGGGAGATVQGAPSHIPSDTIFAAGAGSLYAAQDQIVINQGSAGDFVLASWSGGQETLNAASGATENIFYSGAEGAVVSVTGGNLTVFDTPVTLGGGSVVTGQVMLLGSSGNVTLAGGVFDAGAGLNLTAIGSSDVINSDTGTTLTLADGAAATVQGTPMNVPADTITAAGAGSLSVLQATAVVTQTNAANFVLASSWGGQVTLNAAANATETITYTGAEGAYVSASGDDLTLDGNYFTVATSGSDTLNAIGASAVAINAAAGSNVVLGAGGNFSIAGAGSGASLTLGANDTIRFAAGVDVAALLGATPTVLSATAGGISGDTITASGTWFLSGSQPDAVYHVIWAQGTSNTIYFGAPYSTDANGNVIQQINPGVGDALIDNNIVVYGGTGSQTVFGGGAAAQYGVGNQFWGGSAGNNLLVGAYTIVGGGAGDTLVAGQYTQSIKAASGNETLMLGTGNETIDFGTGNESIFGSTVPGSPGTYSFVDLNLTTAGTTASITDFVTGADKIDLFSTTNTANSGSTANVSGQTNSGGDTFVSLSDGVTIRFVGVSSVSATDFVTNVGSIQVGKVT